MIKLGATGKFPEGKLDEDDEGELRLAIGGNASTGLVEIHFGTQVQWMAIKPEQAIAMANTMIDHAKALIRRRN